MYCKKRRAKKIVRRLSKSLMNGKKVSPLKYSYSAFPCIQ